MEIPNAFTRSLDMSVIPFGTGIACDPSDNRSSEVATNEPGSMGVPLPAATSSRGCLISPALRQPGPTRPLVLAIPRVNVLRRTPSQGLLVKVLEVRRVEACLPEQQPRGFERQAGAASSASSTTQARSAWSRRAAFIRALRVTEPEPLPRRTGSRL